ncbi:MAG: patatin-like phospholipase family protein [Polyangiaceae bacterium]
MTAPEPPAIKLALCLPGGGFTGALYQIGALAALGDGIQSVSAQAFSVYLGSGTGATVAAALAGGIDVDRIYKALLDPADPFFPLERSHILQVDGYEWRRTFETGWVAIRHALARLSTHKPSVPAESPYLSLLEQMDRLNDSLPAGLLRLDRYERFLAEFFLRRGIPNTFRAMPRSLLIAASDLDSGERALFGSTGFEDVPVSLACSASMALPLFFSPVRIGERHYLDGGLGHVAHLDVAESRGADLAIVVNPLVPVSTTKGVVPTGHGVGESVRDKGMLWTFNQALRIGAHARLHQDVARYTAAETGMRVLVVEPRPSDALLFMHNPAASIPARRAILEYAYRTTRERLTEWTAENSTILDRLGWK